MAMDMCIPEIKLKEIKLELQAWKGATQATKKQIQTFLGKLIYISHCVEPARLYLNRIIASLTSESLEVVTLTDNFMLDFNGLMSSCPGLMGCP